MFLVYILMIGLKVLVSCLVGNYYCAICQFLFSILKLVRNFTHNSRKVNYLLKNYFVEKSMRNSRENNFFQNHFRILQRSKLSTCNRIPEERNALTVQSEMEKRWFPGDLPFPSLISNKPLVSQQESNPCTCTQRGRKKWLFTLRIHIILPAQFCETNSCLLCLK